MMSDDGLLVRWTGRWVGAAIVPCGRFSHAGNRLRRDLGPPTALSASQPD